MAPKLSSFLLVVAVAVVVLSSPARGALLGGWQNIDDLTDPEVVKIARFAVDEHNNAEKTSLSYVRLVRGEKQVVSGINFRLVVAATDGGADPKNYTAVVWCLPRENKRQLLSFEKATE